MRERDLTESETLYELAHTANARIYVNFERNAKSVQTEG
jgi:hypothetical protein